MVSYISKDETKEGGCEVFGFSAAVAKTSTYDPTVSSIKLNLNKHKTINPKTCVSQTKSFDDTITKLLEETPKVDDSKDSIPPKQEEKKPYVKPEWADKKNDDYNTYEYSDGEVEDASW